MENTTTLEFTTKNTATGINSAMERVVSGFDSTTVKAISMASNGGVLVTESELDGEGVNVEFYANLDGKHHPIVGLKLAIEGQRLTLKAASGMLKLIIGICRVRNGLEFQ